MGATGVLVAIRLIDDLVDVGRARDVELLLIDKSPAVGAGVAYGTAHACHLVNMRTETMSLFDDRPGDFAAWLSRRQRIADAAADAPAYVPRRLFAEYARTCLAEAVGRATAAGMMVTPLRAEATDCTDDEHGVVLMAGTRRLAVDVAVLALGDLPPTRFDEHARHPRFVHSPWDFPRYERIPASASVAVLGAGLTAIDVLLLLHDRGHRGRLACFTRRSGLPRVQPRALESHVPRVVTHDTITRLTDGHKRKLTLDQVKAMFVAEIEGATRIPLRRSYEPELLRGEHSHTRLEGDIESSRNDRVSWYGPLTSTWRTVPYVWRAMNDTDKADFMRTHYSYWGMFRHCMPLGTALVIAELMRRGQLTVHSGLDDVSPERANGFRLSSRTSACTIDEHRYDHVINATGTGFEVERSQSKLVRSMLHRGDLVAHPLGGVDVEFDSLRARSADHDSSRRVFFIGPLTRGVHFYTNGVEISREFAKQLSRCVVAEIDAGVTAREAGAVSC